MDIKIKNEVRQTFKNISNKLKLNNVSLIIREVKRNKKTLEAMWGVGGSCPNSKMIELSIDPTHPKFKKNKNFLITSIVAHELNHIVRRRSGINISHCTFLECLWSEGLADYYAVEITGKRPVWNKKLKNKRSLLKKAQPLFNKYCTYKMYEDWFVIGSKKKKISRWTGYSLGYEMVKKYLKNKKQKWTSLINIPVNQVNFN